MRWRRWRSPRRCITRSPFLHEKPAVPSATGSVLHATGERHLGKLGA